MSPLSISTSKFEDNDESKIIFSDSNVFIATNNGFNVFNKRLKTFKRYFKGKNSKLTSNKIVGIEEYENKLFIASENELVVFNKETSNFENVTNVSSPIESILSVPNSQLFLRSSDADYEILLGSDGLKLNRQISNSIPKSTKLTKNENHFLFWNKGSSSIIQTDFNFLNKRTINTDGIINSVNPDSNTVYFGTNSGVEKLENENVSVSSFELFNESDFFYVFENYYVNIYNNTIEIKDLNKKQVYKKSYPFNFSKMSFETDEELIFIGQKDLFVFNISEKSYLKIYLRAIILIISKASIILYMRLMIMD